MNAPRPSLAELGYFESIGRTLKPLTPRQRIRVLTACLVAHSADERVSPAATAEEVRRAATVYEERLALLESTAPYDGLGLLGWAFPLETP